eukprot:scaffold14245_cov47-Attheya_sp.AAC.1
MFDSADGCVAPHGRGIGPATIDASDFRVVFIEDDFVTLCDAGAVCSVENKVVPSEGLNISAE